MTLSEFQGHAPITCPFKMLVLVHGQVTIIFVVSVCLSVCLCRVFLSRLSSGSIKLGHMLYVWV